MFVNIDRSFLELIVCASVMCVVGAIVIYFVMRAEKEGHHSDF